MKLVILGVDSTHTEAFCEALKSSPELARRAVVAGLWGENPGQAKEKANQLGISHVFDSRTDAIAAADGVLVLGRFPESHLEPARQSLLAGKPTYIDKPFVLPKSEVKDLISVATEAGAPLISCSVYRFAKTVRELVQSRALDGCVSFCMSGPRECNDLGNDPRFQDISFYGIHLIETMLALLGHEVIDFQVSRSERVLVGNVIFSDGRPCTLQFMGGIPAEDYHLLAFDGKRWTNHQINYDPNMYQALIHAILDQFEGKAKSWPIQSNQVASRMIACLKGENWNA